MIAPLVLLPALLVGALMTFAGLLAPVFPLADFANHFRPCALAATGALIVCALALRAPRIAWASAALAGINAALVALPLWWSAQTAEQRGTGQALASAPDRNLKIVSFNLGAAEVHPLARFLLEEDADIVVLREIGAGQARSMRPLLQARYPHSHTCGLAPGCDAAIFAKRAWVAAGQEPWTRNGPEVIWVEFNDREVGRMRVVGAHVALPFRPEDQVRHIDRLIALRASHADPMIIAADFNMTPWSYGLQRFLARADLRRHATFMRSWPTDGQYWLPFPAFLIDHVITTPDIRTVSIRTGPNLGSDHLPVIAVLRLPQPQVGSSEAQTQHLHWCPECVGSAASP
jgi:endonuclease/exonuclease/phosphatase (EEP) superfamily protein YafD